MCTSSPRGPATSAARNRPTVRPVARRSTALTSQPKLTAWYANVQPTGTAGATAASPASIRSVSAHPSPLQVRKVAASTGASTPEVCDSRWRTRTRSLPFAANAGQRSATYASTSTRPRSWATCRQNVATPLEHEKMTASVSRCHGCPGRDQPPHRSTTLPPRWYAANPPPPGARPSSRSTNRSRTGSKPGATSPPHGVGAGVAVGRSDVVDGLRHHGGTLLGGRLGRG